MLDRGEIGLDDQHRLRSREKSPGSGVLRFLHAGLELSRLRTFLYLMMSISDNTATNILIEMAGMDRMQRHHAIARDEWHRSSAGRWSGRLAIEGEPENLATPDDYTRAVGAIVQGEAASTRACRAMLATLERQQNARRIGRHVPADSGYRWGVEDRHQHRHRQRCRVRHRAGRHRVHRRLLPWGRERGGRRRGHRGGGRSPQCGRPGSRSRPRPQPTPDADLTSWAGPSRCPRPGDRPDAAGPFHSRRSSTGEVNPAVSHFDDPFRGGTTARTRRGNARATSRIPVRAAAMSSPRCSKNMGSAV